MRKLVFLYLFLNTLVIQAYNVSDTVSVSDTLLAVRDTATVRDSISVSVQDSIHSQDSIRALDEVVVSANRVEHTIDGEMYRITRDMRRAAQNTGELIGNLPNMSYNFMTKELRYAGSTNILILVDSVEKPADFIKNLHHVRYKRILVIDHPQGQYSGYDLLINLYTDPDYEGYEGYLGAHHSVTPNDQPLPLEWVSDAMQFHYVKNKWNFSGSYNFHYAEEGLKAYNYEWERTYKYTGLKQKGIPTDDLDKWRRNRAHTVYLSADYEIKKDHSLSFSYSYNNGNRNAGQNEMYKQIDMANNIEEIRTRIDDNKFLSYGHYTAIFFRGRSTAWRYTADFNYNNTFNNNQYKQSESSGFRLGNHFKDRMNYTRFRTNANRSFFSEKLFLSLGYTNTWKDYQSHHGVTNEELNTNSYLRNLLWFQSTYKFNEKTDFTVGAFAEHEHAVSQDISDNRMIYSYNATFFRRLSTRNWFRFNYRCNVTYPNQDQSSSYGYFIDSLTWTGGNPFLRSNVSHHGSFWIDLWHCFNYQAGFDYSPNSISNITELRNGRLPSDIIGEYIANTPVNYKYRNLWTSMSLTKPMFKDFMIRAELRYSHRKASYQEYMNQGGLWQFSSSIRYTNTMHKFGVIVEYQGYNNNSLSVAPQGKSTMDMDNIMISGYKTFFSDRLSINGGYILPIHLSSGYAKSISDTPVYASKSKEDEFADAINCFYIQIQYRFMGGKSIRQYNRDMSDEK